MKRPVARVHPMTWVTPTERIPGYAIRGRCGHLAGHLTPEEARQLADDLHDAADRLDTHTD